MRAGTRIGPYVVLSELGRGAMGLVFRVRAPDGAERALKLLVRAEERAKQQFERERRLLAQFELPDGFVPLVDSGESPSGPYVVMPLVTGGSLRDRLDRGALGVEETLALGRALARALGKAHDAGVVHRDVKPENVLFEADGRPLLADLGLAKHFRADAAGASQSVALTKSGVFMGTAGYMPAEQMRDAKAVGPASDVFALGAVLFEALGGVPAFLGETPIEVFAKVEGGRCPSVRSVAPATPIWLAEAIESCLAREVSKRPRDGAAALALLAGPRAEETGGRSPLLLGLAVAALAAAALAVVAAFLVWPRPVPPSGGEGTPPPAKPSPPPTPPPPGPRPAPAGAPKAVAVPTKGVLSHAGTLGSYAWRHALAVKSIVCSPDGKHVLSGADDGFARLWATETGEELATFKAPGLIKGVDLTADGTRALAVAGGRVHVFDVAKRATWRTVVVPDDKVTSAVFVGTTRAAVGCESGMVRVWDLELNEPHSPVRLGHERPVVALVNIVEPDKTLYSLDEAGVLNRSRTVALKEAGQVGRPQDGPASAMSLSPDQRWMATARQNGSVIVHDARTGGAGKAMPHPSVVAVAFAPNGRSLFAVGGDSTLRRWDWPDATAATEAKLGSVSESVAVSADSSVVLVGGWDSVVRFFDARTLREISAPGSAGHGTWVNSVAWTDDSKRIVSASSDRTGIIWDAASGAAIRTFRPRRAPLTSVAVRGSYAYVGGFDGSVVRTNVDKDEPDLSVFPAREDDDHKVLHVVATRDGSRLAYSINAGEKSVIVLVDLANGKTRMLSVHAPRLAVSKNGKRVAFAMKDGTLGLWDGREGGMIEKPGVDNLQLIAGLPEDDRLLAARLDGALQVLELKGGRVLVRLEGSCPAARILEASPGGRWAAVYTWGQPLEVFDLATGKKVGEADIGATTDLLAGVAFSPDEKNLAAATQRGVVLRFRIDAPR